MENMESLGGNSMYIRIRLLNSFGLGGPLKLQEAEAKIGSIINFFSQLSFF